MSKLFSKIFAWTTPFLIVFFLWELIVYFKFVPAYIMPPPHKILTLMWQMAFNGTLGRLALISFKNAFIGLSIGSSIGILLSAICAFHKKSYDFFTPLISASYPVPTIIWVPLALLWFGFNSISLIFVISLGCFFATFYNTSVGLKSINPLYIKIAKNLHFSKWMYLKEIVFFSSLPHLLSGLRLAVGRSWQIVIGAEMMAGTIEGLGHFLWLNSEFFKYTEVFVGMFAISLIGLLTEKILFDYLENISVKKWY